MKTLHSLTTAGVILFLCSGSAQALDLSKLYVNGDIGAMFQQDAKWTQNGGSSQNITFNPGIRGDVGVGYNINDSWAAELETGVLWNSIDQVDAVKLTTTHETFDIYTIPVMANIIYKVPLKCSLTPYVGVGVGGATSIASYTRPGLDSSDADFNYAYQAMAGVKYALTKHISLGVGYKFLGTSGQSWYLNQITDHVKTRDVYTHSVGASFTWNF